MQKFKISFIKLSAFNCEKGYLIDSTDKKGYLAKSKIFDCEELGRDGLANGILTALSRLSLIIRPYEIKKGDYNNIKLPAILHESSC